MNSINFLSTVDIAFRQLIKQLEKNRFTKSLNKCLVHDECKSDILFYVPILSQVLNKNV